LTDDPNKPGRNSDGTFAPGNQLGGNKVGSRHRVTRAIEALLEGQHKALTAKAVAMALEGDTVALRLCLDRLAPPRKDSPISIALPPVRTAAEAVEASAVVLESVAAGDVTPDEAGRVMALLAAHRGILETCDLETRLADLEAKMEAEK
jgi:hypothetical protein